MQILTRARWLIALACLAPLARAQPAAALAEEIHTGVFPFYPYAARYQIWEYRPLDQGSRLVQLQIIGSERDDEIVRVLRTPGFFDPWGHPLDWNAFDQTQIEKSVWLNRWDILPSLAQQYYRTGDRSYLHDLLAFLRKWRDENPVPADIETNFSQQPPKWRDMQVSWQVENLAWCYFLARDGLSAAEKRELVAIMRTHAHILLGYFGRLPLNENNHQAHSARAMLYAALLFPDLPDAAGLKAKAFEILHHHLAEAFYRDGNSVELVPGYYPFFASIYRDSYLLCRANGVAPPARLEERLGQFYDYLATVMQPNGKMPPINDSSESDAPVSIRVLADILGRPYPHPTVGSHWFSASDQAVMRDTGSAAPAYVFLDAGSRVLPHWHGGKLGFHLWFGQKAFLVDSGESNYDDPLKLSWYTKPEAHNTLLVDGTGDRDGGHGSLTHEPAGSRIAQWQSRPSCDWAVMEHTGFLARPHPVRWTRHFILLKKIGALVVDQLESEGPHDYTWLYHLLPCSPSSDTGTKAVFTGFPDRNLLLQPATSAILAGPEIKSGMINQESRNVPDPVLHYHARGGTLTQAFLLLPVAGGQPPTVELTQSVTPEATVLLLRGPFGTIRVTLASEGLGEKRRFRLRLARQ